MVEKLFYIVTFCDMAFIHLCWLFISEKLSDGYLLLGIILRYLGHASTSAIDQQTGRTQLFIR